MYKVYGSRQTHVTSTSLAQLAPTILHLTHLGSYVPVIRLGIYSAVLEELYGFSLDRSHAGLLKPADPVGHVKVLPQ